MKSLLNLLLLLIVIWAVSQSWVEASEDEVDNEENTFVPRRSGGGFASMDDFSWDDPLAAWPKARSVWNE